jgi:hypothetical protein
VLCFPATKGDGLNDLNMNYTCLIYGGVMLLALLWYAVDARHWFKGPKINVEHLIHIKVDEGQEAESDRGRVRDRDGDSDRGAGAREIREEDEKI